MGITDADAKELAEKLMAAATAHSDAGLEYEIDDLQRFFLACWTIMTPDQRSRMLATPEMKETLEGYDYDEIVIPDSAEPEARADDAWYRAEAKALYAQHSDDNVEINDDAPVSHMDSGDGAFVQAWLWVAAQNKEEEEGDAVE
jgi:hypothetical protein